MDILLNDLRLAGPDSASNVAPAAAGAAPFAAILSDLPQPAPGDARLTVTDDLQEFANKSSEFNDLQEGLTSVTWLSDGPEAGLQQSLPVTSMPIALPPEAVPAKLAVAVRQVTMPGQAAVNRAEPGLQAVTILSSDGLSAGQGLPPRGSGLPPEAGLPASVEQRPLMTTTESRLAEAEIRTGEQPPAVRVQQSPAIRVQPEPAVLPASVQVTDARARVADTLRVELEPVEPTRAESARISLQAAVGSAPAAGDGGLSRVNETIQSIEARPIPQPVAEQSMRPLPADSLRNGEFDPRQATPVLPDSARSGIPADPRMPKNITINPMPAVETDSAQATESRIAESVGRNLAARDGWLQTSPDTGRLARPDAALVNDTSTDTAVSTRDSINPMSRTAESLPIAQLQSNATPAPTQTLAPASAVASAAPSAPGHSGLPQPLETLTLARDARPSDWGEGIGERVSWLVNHKQNSASIRLDPPALGRLDVQIKLADDATTVTIQAQQAQTRDLIDAAVPRLREFLQEAGMQNVNVDVSHRQEQQLAQGQRQADAHGPNADETSADALDEPLSEEISGSYRGDGLVDTFA